MLTGKVEHALDAKNRITIPAKHREALGAVCMLVMGTLGNLMLFPVARWEEMIRDINLLGDFFLLGDLDRVLHALRGTTLQTDALLQAIPDDLPLIVRNLTKQQLNSLLLG